MVRPMSMLPILRVLLALLVAMPAGIALAPPAFACSCAQVGPAGYVSGADVIVTGTISGPDTAGPGFLPSSTVQYDVRVDQVYRGEGIGRVVAVTSEASGGACGWELIEQGFPTSCSRTTGPSTGSPASDSGEAFAAAPSALPRSSWRPSIG